MENRRRDRIVRWLQWALVAVSAATIVGCEPSQPTPAAAEEKQASAADRPGVATPAPTDARPEPSPDRPPAGGVGVPATFADVVARARPAVVNVYTRTRIVERQPTFHPLYGRGIVPRERIAESLGSGFIIDAEGHVLTNHHVVANATEIGVRLLDDRWFEAELVGSDPKTDVALLRIKNPKGVELPVLPTADSGTLRVGDWVIAIGNPLGLTSTVTVGIASAIGRRNIPIGGAMRYQDFIQTDASINPGNSGGALVNMDGHVVGINTAIHSEGQGIGFAIPINMALDIVPQLKETGHVERSWLGVYADEVSPAVRRELGLPGDGGALVTRVVRGGPAAKAGLKPGDIILRLDGEPVADAADLAWRAANMGVGRTVRLECWRGDRRLETDLTLGALPD